MKKFFASLSLICLCSGLFAQKEDFQLTKNIDIFFSAFKELQNLYVDSIGYGDMMKSAIQGMTDKLDPYTEYVPEEEQSDFDFMTTGRYGGVGSLIQKDSSWIRIVAPYKGFPADEAGLVPGDRLLEIDGNNLHGLTVDKASNMLRGTLGTKVNIKLVKWLTQDTVTVSLNRKTIKVPSIPYAGMLDNGVGYISLTSFTTNCADEFKAEIEKMQKTGQLKSLIIDLRNNGGGRLVDAVKIANLFIPQGIEMVKAKGRSKESELTYTTSEKPILPDLPIAVLVNSGTASASEIVAGTLQDLDKGIIIGTRTFGKGLVQTIRPLGHDAQIKITTAKYYIPSGRCVQAHNFSAKNADGSVAFIHDSLKKEFKTKNGRKVYDGGGIAPDVYSTPQDYSPVCMSLASKNFFFDYALEYFKKNKTITTPDKFALNDNDYKAFTDYLAKAKYDYETASEKMMKQLTATVKREKYDELAKDELEQLANKLKHNKNKDLQISKDEIKNLLESEITQIYYYDAGRIQSDIRYDKQVKEAKEILTNTVKYQNLLTVVK